MLGVFRMRNNKLSRQFCYLQNIHKYLMILLNQELVYCFMDHLEQEKQCLENVLLINVRWDLLALKDLNF